MKRKFLTALFFIAGFLGCTDRYNDAIGWMDTIKKGEDISIVKKN